MKKLPVLLICLSVFALWSCRQEVDLQCAEPLGVEETRQFSLPAFTGVELLTDAQVTLIPGEAFSFQATGDMEILDRLNPDVIDGQLVIAHRGCLGDHEPLAIEVTLPNLHSVILRSEGTITGAAEFACDELRIEHHGTGSIELQAQSDHGTELIHAGAGPMDLYIDTPVIETEMSGAGNLVLAGVTNMQWLSLSGSGTFHGFDFYSQSCRLELTGSGNAEVWVENILRGSSTGEGWVYYRGNPIVQMQLQGDGRVQKVE